MRRRFIKQILGVSILLLVVSIGVAKQEHIDLSSNLSASTSSPQATIVFVGDMMLDRYIRTMANAHGGYDYILEDVASLLLSGDAVIGNLEGPVFDARSVSQSTKIGSSQNMRFVFDPVVVTALNAHNFTTVFVGNNHILDFGNRGLEATRRNLTEGDLNYFGDPYDPRHFVATTSLNGVSLSFVGYNEFGPPAFSTTRSLVEEQRADVVVVYTHWGDEYASAPREDIKQKARSLIESGADLVVGSHPHVIQGKEKYRDGIIYYSLGNFIFDQYFSSETTEGLAVCVDVSKEGIVSTKEITVQMKRSGKTTVVHEATCR